MRAAAEKSAAVFGLQMRKKWLWLLVLPILGCGAVFWARNAAWKKVEAESSALICKSVSNINSVAILVDDSEQHSGFFGNWEKADFLSSLDEMWLMNSHSDIPNVSLMIYIALNDDGGALQELGFWISLNQDQGWVTLPETSQVSRQHYELTPESCRAFKKRVFALRRRKDGELFTPQ